MISPELVDRMRTWRHSGFHVFAGDEISDIDDAIRVGLYMVRGPRRQAACTPIPTMSRNYATSSRGPVTTTETRRSLSSTGISTTSTGSHG
jgi:hypothetical protein